MSGRDQPLSFGDADLRPPLALPPGTRLHDYEVVRFLGQGGFGITYEGRHVALGRRVAIKEFFIKDVCRRSDGHSVTLLPDEDLTPEFVQKLMVRFLDEARKVSNKFNHPNIVKGENYFEANSVVYFVMEYIEGQTFGRWLRTLAREGRSPSEAELRPILGKVLDAIEYIHQMDELHRDLKPDNIMLRADGTPVIIDFGASRSGLDRTSHTTIPIASEGFAPPEQLTEDGEAYLGRYTDIYALGATFYRAVVGVLPKKASERTASFRPGAAASDPYVPAARAVRDPSLYSPAFLAAIDRAMELDERRRPQNIAEWRRDLGWDTAAPPPLPKPPPVDEGNTILVPPPTPVGGFGGQRPPMDHGPGPGHGHGQVSNTVPPTPPLPPPPPEPGKRWIWIGATVAAVVVTAAGAILYERLPRLQQQWREEAALTDAGFDEERLAPLAADAETTSVRAEARRRIDVANDERERFAAARNSIASLEAMVAAPCEACVTREEAQRRIEELRGNAGEREEQERLDAARFERGQLLVLSLTATSPRIRAEARRRLDLADDEQKAYEAVRDDAEGLRRFLARPCEVCALTTQARTRLAELERQGGQSREIQQSTVLQQAGFGTAALRGIVDSAASVIVKDEARRRIAVVAAERAAYEAARDDITALRAFVGRPCEACTQTTEARARLATMDESLKRGEAARLTGQALNAYVLTDLGFAYDNARGGLAEDQREALRLYGIANDQGNITAQYWLGWFNENGRGGLARDDRAAARYYRQGVDRGYRFSQWRLGVFAEAGRGDVPRDDREAARLYRLAADQGHPAAQVALARFHANGRGGLPRDEREAVRYYRLAADQNFASAQASLGWYHENGRGGLEKNGAEAFRLYKAAADQGNALGQFNLGVTYAAGNNGVRRDDIEAARLYRLAADQGEATAQSALGSFYENGRGGLQKNEQEAARLYRLAVAQNDVLAMRRLARLYEVGLGVPQKDEVEALRLYRLAASFGSPEGNFNVALFTALGKGGLTKDAVEAARLYRLAADRGYAPAIHNLGNYYASGLGGLKADDREAARLYKLGVDQDYSLSQDALAGFYAAGRGGLQRDDVEAVRLYKLAADQNVASAMRSLAAFYRAGRGGLARNEDEARRLTKLADDIEGQGSR